MLGVELVKPGAVVLQLAAVPAEVMVVGNGVGDLDVLVMGGCGGDSSHGGQTGGVHLMAEVIEHVVVVQNSGVRVSTGVDLVGKAPDHDGGMVVILGNQFHHLAAGVVHAAVHMGGDVGDLSPNYQTALITEVIEILVVLIVGKSNGGGTHFADQIDVFFMVLRAQCIAVAPAVLMTGNTTEGVLFPIEDEALVRMDLKAAAAEAGGDVVQNLLALYQIHFAGVQVGVNPAMPLMDVFKDGIENRVGADFVDDGVAVCINDGVLEVLAVFHILDEHFHFHIGVVAVDNGGDLDAGAAAVFQIKVTFGNADQVHIPVQTAVEGKVCILRVDGGAGGIVHLNDHQIGTGHGACHVHTPGGVATVMGS